jgi:O-antigen/teichoic acid export membrane protein
MSVTKKLISNAIYLFLDWSVLTLIGSLYWLIAAKTLSPYDLGVISTSINLSSVICSITTLGLGAAVSKLIPEYLAKKEIKKVKYLMRFPLKIIVPLNLLVVLIFFLFSSTLASVLKIPSNAVLLTGLLTLIFVLSGQFGWIIYGFQDMKKFLITDSLGQIAKVLIAVTLIFLGFGYLGPLIGIFFGFLVITLTRFFSINFKGEVEKVDSKEIFLDYAFPAFISTLAWIFFLNGQYVLLTILKLPEVTGIFTVAMLIAGAVATFPNILNQALFPIISQLSVDSSSEEKQKYLLASVVRYTLFLTLPLIVFLILFSKQVILIFSRPEYLPAAELLPILVFGSLSLALAQIFNSSLYAIGKTRISRNNSIATTLIFFIFAIPLTILFSAVGLSISYLIATLSFFFISFFFLRKFLKISLPIDSLKKLIPATILTFSFLYLALKLTQGILIGILLTGVAGVIYLLALIPLKFYNQQDVKLLEFFSSRSPILRKQIKLVKDFLSKYLNHKLN